MLKTRTVSSTEEKRIVTGLIVSTEFFKAIKPLLKIEYFKNSYLQTVAVWCDSFFEEYKKAPWMHIKDIFNAESHSLKETEVELIEILLNGLSEQYDQESINVKYWVETAQDYFRSRELEITVNNISVLNEKGDLEAAEAEIENFKKVAHTIDSGVLINPGDIEQQEKIYKEREEGDKNFFRLPGALGKYLGNQKRGDVVGYYGPAKRGKSFTLIDQFKHGVLNKRKTLFWSIEMTRTEILPRVNKAFYPMVDDDEGEYSFPVFDCVHNQTGECADRNSGVVLLEDGMFIDDPAHVICTKCSKSHDKYTQDRYKMHVYKDKMFFEPDDIFTIRKKHKHVKKILNKYGRLSVHPKYTLTYDGMMRDLELYDTTENFIPEILLLDYVDILDIGSKFNDYREDDEKWKLLAKIAGETNTLVITATQANKAGHEAGTLDATHQGGFYGKNRHVNLMVGLNQDAEEKKNGIMRFGITEARDIKFFPGVTCTVLQNFETGQAYLDSYYQYA